jgi:putative iron-regulated protein
LWSSPQWAGVELVPVAAASGDAPPPAPTSYALSAAANDASAQIEAFIGLVRAGYAQAAVDARGMRDAITALLGDPTDERLAEARMAWLNARPAYLRTEVFRFSDGPIEAIEGRINAWPLNEAFIDYVEGDAEAGLVNDPTIELTTARILGKDQVADESDVTTGWHAVEFLLWGQDHDSHGPGGRPAGDFAPGIGNNDRRRLYLTLVTDMLVADLESLAAAWADDGPDTYPARLRAMDQVEALGRMLNGMAILAGYEMMSERLTVALDSGDQEDEHSCFSDNTVADFVHDLRGIRAVWFGDVDGNDGAGLDALVRAWDPALADRVTALFNQAEAAVADLDQPFDRILAAPPGSRPRQEAEAAANALGALSEGLVAAGRTLGVLVQVPG